MDKQRSYRVVLRNKCSQGKAQWTQYEMWPATDPAGEQNALLVSTLSVTHQRELELQLEAAKDQLLRCSYVLARHGHASHPVPRLNNDVAMLPHGAISFQSSALL